MPRKLVPIGALVALIALIAIWQFRGDDSHTSDEDHSGAVDESSKHGLGDDGSHAGTQGPNPRIRMQGESAAAKAFGSVSGRVVDLESKEPVPYVDVIFGHGRQESSATSDASGRYEISLAMGVYEVRAIGEDVIAKAGPTLRVGRIDNLTYDVQVVRLATLRGRVITPDRQGIGGVEVALRSETSAAKQYPQRGEIGLTSSESDGSFEIMVPPGKADLLASDGERKAFASTAKIASGALIENIEIILDNRGIIAGMVRMPDGGAAVGAEIFVSVNRPGTGQYDRFTAQSDAGGQFRIEGLRPGRYVVEALYEGLGSSKPEVLNLKAAQQKEDMQLSLHKPVSLSGTVVDENGDPVGNAQVAQVWIHSKQRYAKLETSGDGRFEFTGLGPGPHMVRARKEGFASVELRKLMALKNDIELRLLNSGGLHGTVADAKGEPISRFTVQYRAKGKKTGPSTQVLSADGRFDIYPVDPGQYTVTISAPAFAAGTLKSVVVPSAGYGAGDLVLKAK